MTRRADSSECRCELIGFSLVVAAAYVGVGASTFEKAVTQGAMPQARKLFGRVLWDAEELHAAFRRLPRNGLSRQNAADDDGEDWSQPSA